MPHRDRCPATTIKALRVATLTAIRVATSSSKALQMTAWMHDDGRCANDRNSRFRAYGNSGNEFVRA
ncbi:hypothetical protein ACSQ67_008678 [Phaseolus vulgaris]